LNAEAGFGSGKIIKTQTVDFGFKGKTHWSAKENPQ
jgi:hypothetical protein